MEAKIDSLKNENPFKQENIILNTEIKALRNYKERMERNKVPTNKKDQCQQTSEFVREEKKGLDPIKLMQAEIENFKAMNL